MLRTRVITALVLAAAFLSALFLLPAMGWAAVVAVVSGLAGWEWAGLLGRDSGGRLRYGLLILLATAAILAADAMAAIPGALTLFAVSLLFWCLIAPIWLARKWRIALPPFGVAVGFLVLVPTALALVMLRTISPAYLLAVMAVVWVADIAAYFVGRALGRHKLAPGISPGKSWEGAVGGIGAVLVYGFVAMHVAGYGLEISSAILLAALLVGAAVLSILGDLFESLAKRQIGVKDSSHLLPGHGGLLDRIDSLTATLPAVALISVNPFVRAKLGL